MVDTVIPFFSVIIPIYNRAGKLAKAVRSVLEQTCQDFEIIVVDDGSRDNPKEVLDQIGDPRIRYCYQQNRGGGAARNRGIDLARGRFIAPLDSDDQFLPHHLEAMKSMLATTTKTAGYAPMEVDRGGGVVFVKPPRAIRPKEHMANYLLCDRGFVPTITIVVETSMARNVRYHEKLHAAEDTDFAIRLYLAGCRFIMAERPGAIWCDAYDPARTSAGRKGSRLLPWIENLRLFIPARAYHGCRGWAIAKGIARYDRFGALKLYLSALWNNSYSPRLAGIVFLQIFLPDHLYRRIADGWIALKMRRGDARHEDQPRSSPTQMLPQS